MFGYFLAEVFGEFDFSSFMAHAIVTLIAFVLFYSFIWNIEFRKTETKPESKTIAIDAVICCVALGVVCAVYVLFCGVSFTYLFAGAGLPPDMTYAEYAREGFAQTVTVCAINLIVFGAALRYGAKHKAVSVLMCILLALTAVMLFSGFVRLKLYIDVYGLTWLRLISAWFIIYLAATIIICAVKMAIAKIPAAAICAMILLGWYLVLGFANPDKLTENYNQSYYSEAADSV
ncbi:MAG: DUF4173 domain-containing protein [Oscillospiraceae bacterium]|jgi:hypothetical protein|nr:DUF4173 domain-containing protein [Oscillospiraceae bacterium]